ncbi:unnamed protein product, partial [Polarella glacialis]
PRLRQPSEAQIQRPTRRSLNANSEETQSGARTWGAPLGAGLLGSAALAVGASSARRGRQARRQQATFRRATITSIMDEPSEAEVDDMYSTEENTALVKKTSVLVFGATGTLGRQVVRQMLNAGYSVRCVIRNRADRQFTFLVDWGATVVEGALNRPETIPGCLVGIHTVVDCATARPEESIYDCDWDGKKNLIQCCEKMKIQRYLFMSIKDCDKFQTVPLMKIKHLTEKFLKKSKLRYTILRHSGFMQPLVSQYACSVLDDQKVWGDDGQSPGIAYIDSQDCARMLLAAASKERTIGQTITITGPKVWSTQEVIALCEKLSGKKADVNSVSTILLQLTQGAAGCFEWSIDIAERLRFVEVNQQKAAGTEDAMSDDTYRTLSMDKGSTRELEDYIGEYYRRVFKKLTKGKYEPEDGEVEREKAESEAKLKMALNQDTADNLPAGQPAEDDVTIVYQRNIAERLQNFFEDRKLAEMESQNNTWFGLTPLSEVFNGRAAMMGFSLGLFTEWATEINVAKQIDQLIAIASPVGAQ